MSDPEVAATGSTAPFETRDGEPLVSCGAGTGFAVSAMDGGVEGLADPAELVAALERLVERAGIDAPRAFRGVPVDEAQWFVLGRTEDVLTVATGAWGADGPSEDAGTVSLEQSGDGWEARGWGDCNLAPVPPRGESWVRVRALSEELDRAATSVPVLVSEVECTSGRDPGPHLNDPIVLETDETVTVYWTSIRPEGGADCPGNPTVERRIDLERPLGDRALQDGSTWPPRVNR